MYVLPLNRSVIVTADRCTRREARLSACPSSFVGLQSFSSANSGIPRGEPSRCTIGWLLCGQDSITSRCRIVGEFADKFLPPGRSDDSLHSLHSSRTQIAGSSRERLSYRLIISIIHPRFSGNLGYPVTPESQGNTANRR